MTDIALYPGDRRTGKTTMILRQIIESVSVGQTVALVTFSEKSEIKKMLQISKTLPQLTGKFMAYSEATISRSRGRHFDHVYIDDADLFQDNPIELVASTFPGVPVTVTYTPTKLV